jgi:hypothetical protein
MARHKRRSINPPVAGQGGEPAVAPTRETAAKLRHDVVIRLYNEGRLRSEYLQAAQEIRAMWEAFGRALFPSARNPGSFHQPHHETERSDLTARLSLAEEARWRSRYRPWADEMWHEVVAAMASVSRLQLVLDIVVDNNEVREVEDWYRMRHGLGLDYLQGALHRYCEIAGWIEPDPPP